MSMSLDEEKDMLCAMWGDSGTKAKEISDGWFLVYDKRSSLDSQTIIFNKPGAPSNYHGGQKSEHHINGAARTAFYCLGDPDRKPPKDIINRASEMLFKLNEEGKLFTLSKRQIEYLYKCSVCGSSINIKNEGYGTHSGTCDKHTEKY